ncbi:hypothetical protein BCL90_0950 [Pedobacter alluvionis]|uniref:Uncharacterized protein n=1 Tax=Pedobacter alluvionis TaxID=475253 RepID=A0A497Y9G4_9SPHI|nr:hypothetical protein BCL90_0950 [Pedobacter alluvionis]
MHTDLKIRVYLCSFVLKTLNLMTLGASLSHLGTVVADLGFPKLNKLIIHNNHFIKA